MQSAGAESRKEARYFRETVCERADWHCEVCGFYSGPITEVHHVVPVSDGGSGWPENLIALCPNCHRSVTACSKPKSDMHAESLERWLRHCTNYTDDQAQLLIELVYRNAFLDEDGVWKVRA